MSKSPYINFTEHNGDWGQKCDVISYFWMLTIFALKWYQKQWHFTAFRCDVGELKYFVPIYVRTPIDWKMNASQIYI